MAGVCWLGGVVPGSRRRRSTILGSRGVSAISAGSGGVARINARRGVAARGRVAGVSGGRGVASSRRVTFRSRGVVARSRVGGRRILSLALSLAFALALAFSLSLSVSLLLPLIGAIVLLCVVILGRRGRIRRRVNGRGVDGRWGRVSADSGEGGLGLFLGAGGAGGLCWGAVVGQSKGTGSQSGDERRAEVHGERRGGGLGGGGIKQIKRMWVTSEGEGAGRRDRRANSDRLFWRKRTLMRGVE